jgi:RHS repeat-associated protein
VARETRGAHGVDYVRGLQLIRQADSGGVQIYPLHGHLATSLGAVDAHGNIIEQVEADAFGVLQHGALKQAHLYSGEYVDADTQLVYLRARWYDPRIGRFVSADPFEGRPQDPRSLNRYGYAHSDPVHGTDPSGEVTLGEVGTTLSNIGSLATRAYNAYDFVHSLVAPNLDDESESSSEKPTIWDSLMAVAIRALDPSTVGTVGFTALAAAVGGTEKHHVIPVYMCGAKNQTPLVPLVKPDHYRIHTLLDASTYAIDVLGKAIHFSLSRRKVPSTKPFMKYVARTSAGRGAILGMLTTFYASNGHLHQGYGVTIQQALGTYGPVFVASRVNTSWSANCKQ